MPCCFDALSARLIERAGFEISFMSGFSTSAAKLGLPDTGYISYGEMIDAGRDICTAVSIPVLADGDTGRALLPLLLALVLTLLLDLLLAVLRSAQLRQYQQIALNLSQ